MEKEEKEKEGSITFLFCITSSCTDLPEKNEKIKFS